MQVDRHSKVADASSQTHKKGGVYHVLGGGASSSCFRVASRLWPKYRDYVWSYDFVMVGTSGGRAFRMLSIGDEQSWACLSIDVAWKLTSEDVLGRLSDPIVRRGVPEHFRNGSKSEFTAK